MPLGEDELPPGVMLRTPTIVAFHLFIFADSGVAETVTWLAMRLFQRLALDKNQLAIKSAPVTARSIVTFVVGYSSAWKRDSARTG